MNIANLIKHVVAEVPALEKEIDKVEEGTYDTATKGIYEPAKSWIPGDSTIVTKSVQTNEET
jgi:hypothetical protein